MTIKHKKIISLGLLVIIVLLSYWLWLSLRPVEIVAVHREGSHSSVLVKTFPLTDKGKINWWLSNKEMLKNKYNIPGPDANGSFIVVFWYFGDGYKEEGKYDRRCFDDMKIKVNCIDKDKAFTVWNSQSNVISFGVNDGEYRINDKGAMIKTEYH
ncbi:DUF943 family protein [Pseudescherichia vulneris]|uniref:DUF943 family protein n=1 Tax=Pseudescherichia vulneris TaxID=566 RepID=UPI0030C983F0